MCAYAQGSKCTCTSLPFQVSRPRSNSPHNQEQGQCPNSGFHPTLQQKAPGPPEKRLISRPGTGNAHSCQERCNARKQESPPKNTKVEASQRDTGPTCTIFLLQICNSRLIVGKTQDEPQLRDTGGYGRPAFGNPAQVITPREV